VLLADGEDLTDGGDLPLLDTSPPLITSVELEGGAATTQRNTLSLAVTVEDASPPIEVRIANAHSATNDCQSEYVDDGWQTYTEPEGSYSVTISVMAGIKKVCVWAKDSLGNVSIIEPSEGTLGVNMDTIEYLIGTLPVITQFEVHNDTPGPDFGSRNYQPGDQVRIEWAVTDNEGLANNPISLSYTTDNDTWTPILENYGNLNGNPTDTSDVYTGFAAPGSAYFRLKLVAKDMAGNIGVAALSDSQNTANWSIYAGSSDSGLDGTGLGVRLPLFRTDHFYQYALDPTTNDVYAFSDSLLVRLDAKTGLVSRVMTTGTPNLPDDGPLPADPLIGDFPVLRFDHNGLLYTTVDNKLFQVDLKNAYVRAYLGGGDVFDDTATPASVALYQGPFAFDEDNNLYFLASCTPGVWDASSTVRLMKATQNPDQTAGDISVVAGNCVRADPPSPGPADALAVPFTGAAPFRGTMTVWDRGAVIYYTFVGAGTRKIINGQNYSSNVVTNSLLYNPTNNKLYAAYGSIIEYTPNLLSSEGDVGEVFVSSTGSGVDCVSDGVDADQACVNSWLAMDVTTRGTLLFNDRPKGNENPDYRIRYKDPNEKVGTYLGHLSFHGDGMDRRMLRGSLSGIHFKPESAPNQVSFPAGLYFLESGGPIFGYIDPVTELTTVLWGNQSGMGGYSAGTDIQPGLGLGDSYLWGNGRPLTFDDDGLPWLRYDGRVEKVDSGHRIVGLQGGSFNYWDQATDGSNPYDYSMYVHGLWQNIALKDEGVFLIGRYLNPEVTIMFFDFQAGVVTKLMGNPANEVSPDNSTPGSVKSLSVSIMCAHTLPCFLQYRADEDRLYFGERNQIRYITTPTDTNNATLGTIFDGAPGVTTVGNFIFRSDGSQLFYVAGGELRCHDITSGMAWCDDSPLGPVLGLASIINGPNQLTWKDDGHLLISNYQGEIYEYTLPP
jgi:hypothetical protein